MKTKITELLGIKYPILQGAMAQISDADLVSAVSNAGGLGILASSGKDVTEIKKMIEETLDQTDKPFAVNLYMMHPNIDEIVDYVCRSGVKIVTTGAGNPSRFMEQFKEAGIKVLPVVPSVGIAVKMERAGADAIIVEGMEAGGHIGRTTTMALVPQVADAVEIPIVAAGGIADGRGMLASFSLGAEGVQVGTRFIVAKEANTHPAYKEKVIKASDVSTAITGNILGHPVRILQNQLASDYIELEREIIRNNSEDIEPLNQLATGSLERAVFEGDIENGSLMAGQVAGLIQKEETCQEIIDAIMSEAKTLYENQQRFFNRDE